MLDSKEIQRLREQQIQNITKGFTQVQPLTLNSHLSALNLPNIKGDKNNLQKSHITDLFGNSKETFPLTFKGSEIKEKLQEVKVCEEKEMEKYLNQLQNCLCKINIMPDEEVYEYHRRGIYFPNLPKMYSYELKEKYSYCPLQKEEQLNKLSVCSDYYNSNTPENREAPKNTVATVMREYNRCIEKYVEELVEIKIIDTLLSTLNDTTTYSLTPVQACVLKF
jgi:hypothetical protein